MQTVTRADASSRSRSSASGAACGSTNSSARPGTASHDASPVSHRLTGTPLATAVAATVTAWDSRSGAS